MSVLASPEYVNAGSRVVWTGEFSSLFWKNPADAIIAVSSYLLNNYNLVVEATAYHETYEGLGTSQITLHLKTNIDRGDGETDDGLTDILSNVNEAFTSVGGNKLVSSSLNNYSSAAADGSNSAGATVNTGSPQPTVEQIKASVAATTASGGHWYDNLIGQVAAGSTGFIFGAVAVVGVLVYLTLREG
jgi:hypothetical protein